MKKKKKKNPADVAKRRSRNPRERLHGVGGG